MQTTTTSKSGQQSTPASSSPCGCGCSGSPVPAPCTCCNLVCFERPNYFCGHLLTDEDLSLQEKYVIEKNKLYHRALHGSGIVCGLKLTCDAQCKGNVLICEGFAIDNCGNDLVVCSAAHFDVMAELKKQKLLLSYGSKDPCEEDTRDHGCHTRQCFYITICYAEELSDYVTPFQNGCSSGPQTCEPTRVRETVKFGVIETLPTTPTYLQELECQFKKCFSLFTEGPISTVLTKDRERLSQILNGEASLDTTKDNPNFQLFCVLRAYFLRQIQSKPDEISCGFEGLVRDLTCPSAGPAGQPGNVPPDETGYRAGVKDAFCRLLGYMHQYQYDCALGDLAFSCQKPCGPECLVLGAIEVLNGRIVRVCNTPRQYVWSFANFLPVLMNALLTGGAMTSPVLKNAAGEGEGVTNEPTCCPTYNKFDCERFIAEFAIDPKGRLYSATTAFRAFEAVKESVMRSFDFTDSVAISPEIFAGKEFTDRFAPYLKALQLEVEASEAPAGLVTPSLMQALSSKVLMRPEVPEVVYTGTDKKVSAAIPNYFKELYGDASSAATLNETVAAHEQTIAKLTSDLAALQETVKSLKPAKPKPSDAPAQDKP
jgi:hypothetical protein